MIIKSTIPEDCGTVFSPLKNEIADPEGSVMEFEFLVEGKEFSFDCTSMTRVSDEGCSGITFGLNLTIIIIFILVIVVICLVFVFKQNKKDKKHDLKKVENPVNVSQPIPALSTTISTPMKPLPIPDPMPNTTVVNSSIPNIIDVTIEPPSSDLKSISNSTGYSAPIYPYVIPIDIHPQPANSKVSI